MRKKKDIFRKFGTFLMGHSLSGGLEINDTGLRFVNAEGKNLEAVGVRLAPGIMSEGKIENHKEFVRALRVLRGRILGVKARRRSLVNVVVSLSSVNVYTQVFKLPFIEGENLEKAIQLNIQMASPSGTAEDTYAGWQTVKNQEERGMHLEVVTAFLPKGVADDLTAALNAGGFLPIALESRALSLARLVKERASGVEPGESLVAVSADASGLDVMIIRAGHLHFDYFNSWKDLQAGERQISPELFRTLIVRGVNQVMNFYGAHWKDPVSEIVVSSTGLKEEVLAAIRESFDIKVSELTPLVSPPLTPEWYVALGGALRSVRPRRDDDEISLLGVSAKEEFRREQIQNFLDFWRVLVPASLAVLLIAFAVSWFFLNAFSNTVSPRARAANQVAQPPELVSLRADARKFNAGIAMIDSANASRKAKSRIFSVVLELVTRRGIGVERLNIDDPSVPVTLQGSAASEDDIIAFKNELAAMEGFSKVELPLTGIRRRNTDYAFSMTFMATP
jgi:Tfp pilus assembly PilM family ATPase